MCVVLHHQYFVCGATLLGAVLRTALCVPRRTALVGSGQWAMELLLCIATLPGGSGQWNSCHAPPHCLGAMGSGTPAMHCLTAWGQWTVQLLHLRCHTAQGRWAVELLICTATLLGGSGRWNSCNALPHCLGAVGSGAPVMHRHIAWGRWAVELLLCTATLSRVSGQWNSCNALPHCLGAVGSGAPVMHRHTAWGQWAVQLLQYTAQARWAVELVQCAGPSARGTGSLAQEAVAA